MLSLTVAGTGILAIPLLLFFVDIPVITAAPAALLAVGYALFGALIGLRQGMVR